MAVGRQHGSRRVVESSRIVHKQVVESMRLGMGWAFETSHPQGQRSKSANPFQRVLQIRDKHSNM